MHGFLGSRDNFQTGSNIRKYLRFKDGRKCAPKGCTFFRAPSLFQKKDTVFVPNPSNEMGAILISNARILDWLGDIMMKAKSGKSKD